jgi:hypothetical protein
LPRSMIRPRRIQFIRTDDGTLDHSSQSMFRHLADCVCKLQGSLQFLTGQFRPKAVILPENFDRLHKGEELIRSKSKDAIQKSDTLLRHLNMVADSMNLINHFARSFPQQGDDQLIIQLLGIRLFNSMRVRYKI